MSSNLTRRTISPCSPTGRRRLLEVQNSLGSNPSAGTISVCSPTGRRHLIQNENSEGSNPSRRTTGSSGTEDAVGLNPATFCEFDSHLPDYFLDLAAVWSQHRIANAESV